MSYQRDGALDPVGLRLVARQHRRDHEVRRVPAGRQRPRAEQRLVQRAGVDLPNLRVHRRVHWVRASRRLEVDLRLEPDAGHRREELLRPRLVQHTRLVVPSAALEVRAVDDRAALRLLRHAGRVVDVVQHHEIEAHQVDGRADLARVVLLRARDERLREVEARDPENVRDAVVDPAAQEPDPLLQIDHPRRQRLKGRVRRRLLP